MENKYTIAEIKNYIKSQDSLGDVMYNLNDANIREAQILKICKYCLYCVESTEGFYCDFHDFKVELEETCVDFTHKPF